MGKLIQTYTTYEASALVAAVAAGAPICQIAPQQSLATQNILMGLQRLRVVILGAVATTFGLTGAATAGTPTGPGTFNGLAVSAGNGGYAPPGAGLPGQLLTLWTVAPTLAGAPAYFEQDFLPAAIGSRFEWTWPEDDPLTTNLDRFKAGFSKGLVLQNTGVGVSATLLVTARWAQFAPEF
jgi:hypothetical protein